MKFTKSYLRYWPTGSRKFSPYVLVKNNLHFQGRQIVENIILAGECIKSLQSKARKDKWCALKLDMAKAFDSDEWHYIINILKALWFSDKWCRMIHWCISSTPISVSINDRHFGSMKLSRGIRQGDPLSTFLFILPAEGLSRLIKKAEILGNIHSIQITRGAPRLTHLIFAWHAHHARRFEVFRHANFLGKKPIILAIPSYLQNWKKII